MAFSRDCWKQAVFFQAHPLVLVCIRCEVLAFRSYVPLSRYPPVLKVIFSCMGENKPTCGVESMSRLQEHILPSVETVMRLCAFCVPTTLTQYTGCWKHINTGSQRDILTYSKHISNISYLTVKND